MWKNKLQYYLVIILLLHNLTSCNKQYGGPNDTPKTQRPQYLIEYTWSLISATSIASLSTGALHNYKGLPGDSLHFLWGLNPNIDISATCSFIQENGDSVISNIDTLIAAGGVPHSDTSTIAYDTLVTAIPWRPNYSDTLFISKVSPRTLVFQVRYSDAGGSGVEIDSFRNVGFYTPF
jgi:hypothetical protein